MGLGKGILALRIFPLAEIKTLQLRVVRAGEASVQRPLALGDLSIEREDGEFVLGIECYGAVESLAARVDEKKVEGVAEASIAGFYATFESRRRDARR